MLWASEEESLEKIIFVSGGLWAVMNVIRAGHRVVGQRGGKPGEDNIC